MCFFAFCLVCLWFVRVAPDSMQAMRWGRLNAVEEKTPERILSAVIFESTMTTIPALRKSDHEANQEAVSKCILRSENPEISGSNYEMGTT